VENGKNNTLMLMIAGGAAVAIYLVVQKQAQAAAAAAIATNAGVATPSPSFWDVLTGKLPETVLGLLNEGMALDAGYKEKGAKTYAAYKNALKTGAKYFASEYGGAVVCWETVTGAPASGKCTAHTQSVAMLEGYY
jgi:hypothetical protein